VVECVIHYEVTCAAGIEDGVVSVLDTGTVKIWSGKCSRMEGGPEDSFILAICTLMDYSIVDFEIADVLGDARSLVSTDEGKGVMTTVARIVTHPFPTWVVSIPFFSLSGGVRHPCWVSGLSEESGWGVVN